MSHSLLLTAEDLSEDLLTEESVATHRPPDLAWSGVPSRINTKNRKLPPAELQRYYLGNGRPPAGCPPVTRDEHGAYLADERLRDAVRTSIALEKPLLVTGEPGTGKTGLAWSIASELGLGEVLAFHTRSDHRAIDLLYSFDHVLRFYEAQSSSERAAEPRNYLRFEPLGRAIVEADTRTPAASDWRARFAQDEGGPDPGPGRRVVLIDEIDKAPRDFPNDLLDEVDRMKFRVKEIPGLTFKAEFRPIVIITSNSERQLPDPFLRRCVFHTIDFPTTARLEEILRQRINENLDTHLVRAAIERFNDLRKLGDQKIIEKRPATAELEAWVRMLLIAGVPSHKIANCELRELPSIGVLLKTLADMKKLHDLRG
jgi:MoxR-like ATPase